MNRPTVEDRLASLDRLVSTYRGNNAQYAELIRDAVSLARLAVTDLLAQRDALQAEVARLRAQVAADV